VKSANRGCQIGYMAYWVSSTGVLTHNNKVVSNPYSTAAAPTSC
jgi:hypothetical protein